MNDRSLSKAPSQPDPWIGRLLGDRQRYRLDKRLAVEGMEDVFVAMDTLLGQQVTLKLLKDQFVASEERRKRFEREVALCATLKSEHIVVEVSDYGVTDEGYPFFVMEYLRGQSLGQLLLQKQRLSVEQTVSIIAQVCDGLQLAHEGVTLWRDNATASEQVKVVHRDLKPDNIFLVPTAMGELVKILGFGMAKIRETQVEHNNLTSMSLGTFHYAAPEQLKVEKDLDGRADIYSLGIIIYEMLSGTDPFGLGFKINDAPVNRMSWLLAHTSKPLVPLRSQPGLSQLSSELEAVVMRCLQKAPAERFASVVELKQAMLAAVSIESGGASSTANAQQKPLKVLPETTPWLEEHKLNQNTHQQLQQLQQSVGQTKKSTGSLGLKTEQNNFKPTLPISERGEDQKKVRRLLFQSIAAAVALVGGGLAYFSHMRGQDNQSVKTALESAKEFNKDKNYEMCANEARVVQSQSGFYANAQNLLNDCQRLAQDEKRLAQAKELAKKNNFKDAIADASKIHPGSTFQEQAQQLISQSSLSLIKQAQERYKQSYNSKDLQNAIALTKAIPKTSSLAISVKKMRERWRTEWNNNQNYLQAAQDALKQGKWQEAIDKTNKVRLLGQGVKQDTPYWQHQIRPIIQMAQKYIAASKIRESGINNALQPELPAPQHPSLQPIPSPVPQRPIPLVRAQPKPPVPQGPTPLVRAQSTPQSQRITLPPIQLSPEGQQILCQQFPLNSRCVGKHH
ncbi:MAG: protein kinase [Chroococcidiopsidaceae cyanobacterium CP_BM_ER_R8_30]|nr:protein kinase [Chroococcidiopsidaceae cyanobacterium CP_BM_ER_R8_30]